MAEVHIIDINGEQWDVKDLSLTERVANIEEELSVKSGSDVSINMKQGYTTSSNSFSNHYSISKIHFLGIYMKNLAGTNIGTISSAAIGVLDLRPKKTTTFFLYDYLNSAVARCYLNTDGTFVIGESKGVVSGSNTLVGELIFAEP